MSVLAVAIAFLGANFGQSSSDTVMRFIADSAAPDAVYMTDAIPEDMCRSIEEIQGVEGVYPGFVYDTNIETENGDLFSVRAFRRSSDVPFTQTIHEKHECEDAAEIEAAVSVKFAAHNNIHAGDRILISSPFGKKTAVIGSVVSNPETMNCVRDEMSAYESFQFAYLYFDEQDYHALFPAEEIANQWFVYFEDELHESAQKDCMACIREKLGSHIISESLTDESEALNSIREDLHTISVLCRFIPGIIWLIALGFNSIFIRIVVENQRKTIGMLRALGYSIRRVVMIFVTYTVLIGLPALICGVLIGSRLLRLCLGLVASAEGIISVKITILPVVTALMLLAVFAIGGISALLSAGMISRIDPSEAYGGAKTASAEPPEFYKAVKTNVFIKTALVSLLRNCRRQIIGALCIAACIISMCVGFEGMLTIGHPINAVFGGRYRYDLMVRDVDESAVSEIREKVSGVSVTEPEIFFTAELLGKNVRVSTVQENDELTVLSDASGRRLYPKDGIIIDEMFAKMNGISVGDIVEPDGYSLTVTGIAREILYTVMYVSPQTAAKMGHTEPNGALLKLDADSKLSEAEEQLAEVCKSPYLVRFASQKDAIRSGFAAMRTIMLCFAILAFCIGSLLIFNITMIDFNENRFRYAVLRALGTPLKQLAMISVIQNTIRTALGIAIACPLCRVCISVLLNLLSGASQQYVMVKYRECLLLSCIIPILYILLGTAVSLYKIKKMDFCSALNEME